LISGQIPKLEQGQIFRLAFYLLLPKISLMKITGTNPIKTSPQTQPVLEEIDLARHPLGSGTVILDDCGNWHVSSVVKSGGGSVRGG
jgi:hypothetical protein